jgi:hypothetical protein
MDAFEMEDFMCRRFQKGSIRKNGKAWIGRGDESGKRKSQKLGNSKAEALEKLLKTLHGSSPVLSSPRSEMNAVDA